MSDLPASSQPRRENGTHVVAAVLREGDQVLLCHRSPTRRWYPNVWDLPGGHVEPGEPPARALVRELREELGIEIGEPSPTPPTRIDPDGLDLWIWVIEEWSGPVTNTAPDEHDELTWVDADGLAGYVLAHPEYPELLSAVLRRK